MSAKAHPFRAVATATVREPRGSGFHADLWDMQSPQVRGTLIAATPDELTEAIGRWVRGLARPEGEHHGKPYTGWRVAIYKTGERWPARFREPFDGRSTYVPLGVTHDDLVRWCDRHGLVLRDFPDTVVDEALTTGTVTPLALHLAGAS